MFLSHLFKQNELFEGWGFFKLDFASALSLKRIAVQEKKWIYERYCQEKRKNKKNEIIKKLRTYFFFVKRVGSKFTS